MCFGRLHRLFQGAVEWLCSLRCPPVFGHKSGQVQLRVVLEAWGFQGQCRRSGIFSRVDGTIPSESPVLQATDLAN